MLDICYDEYLLTFPNHQKALNSNRTHGTSTSSSGLSASVSSRTTANHSRTTSVNNFSKSTGPNSRLPGAYGGRPKTAMGFSQSTMDSGMWAKTQEEDDAAREKKKRTHSSSVDTLLPVKSGSSKMKRSFPRHHSVQSLNAAYLREVSISSTLRKLKIDGEASDSQSEQNWALSTSPLSISSGSISHMPQTCNQFSTKERSQGGAESHNDSENPLEIPKTPSRIPVLSKSEVSGFTPSKYSRSQKSSNKKTFYLTKHSNIPAFTGLEDIESRIGDMQSMYETLKGQMESAAPPPYEEVIEIYKARGTCHVSFLVARNSFIRGNTKETSS